jgi:glycosyltransferase involved in cell wall biosynthesis
MRVAFDARVLEHRELAERGIGRYAGSLLDALRADGRDLVALSHLRRPPAPARVAELLEHRLLSRDVRRAGAGLLHSPSIDFATTRPGVPYVVTVHDLVPLKRPGEYLKTGIKHRLRYRAVRGATRLIVPTTAVARDCQAHLGVDPARISIVGEAPAPAFHPIDDPRGVLGRFTLPERFFVWVGGLDPPDPRKGLQALVEAAARRDGPPLVLAGRIGAEAAALARPGRVILTGRVSDDELAALYCAADALVFPSEEEGFGLPVVEALACGTPVAAYAIEALEELHAGNGGVELAEPGDADALLSAAESIGGTRVDPPRRSWSDVAAETWAAYEAALTGPTSGTARPPARASRTAPPA